jgi:class 3 adenylate cyclase
MRLNGGVVACALCGEENPLRARFCLGCGSSLGAVPAGRREGRKPVTVVFCDLVGSTSLGERLDSESVRRVMVRYYAEARRVFEGHGGTVEKFIGDAVMAVFGVPVVHEDDALRAVRAAAEMRGVLRVVNDELEKRWDARLQTRIGVNTGEVVTGGSAESFAVGDSVNVAARLEQAAEPGEILLGGQTFGLVRDFVEVQPVGPLVVRGKSERVRARCRGLCGRARRGRVPRAAIRRRARASGRARDHPGPLGQPDRIQNEDSPALQRELSSTLRLAQHAVDGRARRAGVVGELLLSERDQRLLAIL